jgi:Tol biopolymer transport system component
MGCRSAALAAFLLAGCDSGGTVNNDAIVIATTVRVSLSAGGRESNAVARDSHMSGDGRWVAFSTPASNLHADDTDATDDIYVKNLSTGALYLASRASGATGAKGQWASGPSLSHDGRWVAFVTFASLDPDDSDLDFDVYARNLQTHETLLVSRAAGLGGDKGNAASRDARISPDGRWVAFTSVATNLSLDDKDATEDVYLRELETGATELISRSAGVAGEKGNGNCVSPRLSADGLQVAFQSTSTNLSADSPAVATNQIYLRDRNASKTLLVSRASGAGGAVGNGLALDPAVSADGRFVIFRSAATNLDPGDVDVATDVFIRDLRAEATELVSRGPGPAGKDANQGCGPGDLSADGRFAAFTTIAANLGELDENGNADVYVRDRLLSRTWRVSVRTFGGEAWSDFDAPSLSADGKSVAFLSRSDNLVDGDENTFADVFVRGPLW